MHSKKQNKTKQNKNIPKETKEKKTKRYLKEWEKTFTNDVTNKGIISKIYKQLIQLDIKKQTTQFKNGQKI